MKTVFIVFTVLMVSCSKETGFDANKGVFTDSRDNMEYKWTKIGDQVWMAENLVYLPAVYPSTNGSDDESMYYVYGYEGTNVTTAKTNNNYSTYGVLYNWNAAKRGCPSGWHLPSDDEWKSLEKSLGMSEPESNQEGWRLSGSVANYLVPQFGWSQHEGEIGDGFNALPGGSLYFNGSFDLIGHIADFWSSSKRDGSTAWFREISENSQGILRAYCFKRNGFSVRCIKN